MIRRVKRPDTKNALSIIESAKNRIEYTLTLKITEFSATTIAQNIYESFRMLGDAILVSRGVVSEDHIEPLTEISKLQVNSSRPIGLVLNLRQLRHNVNYYGYNPSVAEIEDLISFTKACFIPAYEKVKEMIEKGSNN